MSSATSTPDAADIAPAGSCRRVVDPTIEPFFERLGELCSLPGIAQQVVQIAEDESADSTDMLEVIEKDPAVAARLMKVVNSAYCGLRNPVSDLKAAVTMLGVERVRNLALTVSLGNQFSDQSADTGLDPQRLWDHSVCVATVCRLVAKQAGTCNPDEAYLAGLIHDLGLLFVSQHLETLLPRVLEVSRDGLALPEAERRVMAFDHAQLGAYVAWRSNFPERLVTAIDYHHDPFDAPAEGIELTRVVAVANYLATRFGRGVLQWRRIPAPAEGVLQPMGMNLSALRDLWYELPEAIQDVGELTEV